MCLLILSPIKVDDLALALRGTAYPIPNNPSRERYRARNNRRGTEAAVHASVTFISSEN